MDRTIKKIATSHYLKVWKLGNENCWGYLEPYTNACNKIFLFADIPNSPLWILPNGMKEELIEIKDTDDFDEYGISAEVCGKELVVITSDRHAYVFGKNGNLTTLFTEKNFISTSGKLRVFITSANKLIFRVEENNISYWADYNGIWAL